jgi:hypothetical protein
MPTSAATRKMRLANKALYAPKAKPAPEVRRPPRVEKHSVPDEVLRKIIQQTLIELKLPGKIPSEVLFAALAEVRSLAERASETPASANKHR